MEIKLLTPWLPVLGVASKGAESVGIKEIINIVNKFKYGQNTSDKL